MSNATGRGPVYERIAAALRERIDRGELQPGAILPSEAEIRAEFGVSRGTVRQALAVLEHAGLVDVVPAKGRFVRGASSPPNSPAPRTQAREIAAELRAELGRYANDDQFLSEKEVCERYGVTRYAARQALSELESAGLLTATHAHRRRVRRADRPSPDASTTQA